MESDYDLVQIISVAFFRGQVVDVCSSLLPDDPGIFEKVALRQSFVRTLIHFCNIRSSDLSHAQFQLRRSR